MRPIKRIAAFALIALASLQGCAQHEPTAPPSSPTTSGGEAAAPQPAPLLGNAPSAQMAVEPRQPGPPVDPQTVSSEPSALIQKPEPGPGAQAPAAPVYVAAPPPAPRPEAYPTETSAQWAWAPGYWYWYGGQYTWIGGAWIPARRGHVYVAARWAHTGRGWHFMPGGWAVSAYDPIVYPVYPYDPFYYRDYWNYRRYGQYGHHHHHDRRDYGRSRQPRFVRPEGSLGVRRVSPGRSSSRVRVRAR